MIYVCFWPKDEARESAFSVCYVPKAEVNLRILNVRYRESGPSDIISQGLQCALSGHRDYYHRPSIRENLRLAYCLLVVHAFSI